jgi:beta-galactosidase GanA
MKHYLSIGSCVGLILISLLFAGCKQHATGSSGPAPVTSEIPHLEKRGTATRLVFDGTPFLMISGELHNSTAGGFDYMRPVWKRLEKKYLNSVIATVSWELVEPEEGKFDFRLVDSIIAGARESNLKVVLIWFASWKNASSVYIPSWVKRDYEKYPRVKDELGKPLEILSTFGQASAEADAKAFAALMSHIRTVDAEQKTVLMMQVENEVGVLDNLGKTPGNARRDFSDAANRAYFGQVPQELMNYLMNHKDELFPELYKAWKENGFKTAGTWEEVFGKSSFKPDLKDWKFYSFYTEELFMAWNYGRYIEKVTAAGKKEYPLPMYVNAWLKQPFSYWPGRYPSGGPLPQVLDVWRAAAPSIDFVAPDIYTDEFVWVCKEYTRSGNPLFIPESRGGALGAARAFYVYGEYDAACFAPFGIDNPRYAENDPLDEAYATLQNLSETILNHQGNGSMRGILVDSTVPVQEFALGNFSLEAHLAGRIKPAVAGGLIIQNGPADFYVAGKALDVFFVPKNDSLRIAIERVDEGKFEGDKWVPKRRLNGDEVHASTWSGTGLKLPDSNYSIQHVLLYRYK